MTQANLELEVTRPMGSPRSYSAHELTQLLPVDFPVREIHLEGIPQLDDLEFCKPCLLEQNTELRGRNQRKTWCIGPSGGDDYNLTLCPLQSRPTLLPWATLCQSRP
jgi:hypothetical protein